MRMQSDQDDPVSAETLPQCALQPGIVHTVGVRAPVCTKGRRIQRQRTLHRYPQRRTYFLLHIPCGGKQNVVAGRTEFRYFSFVPKRFPINFCHQGGVGYDQIRLRTVPGSVRRIACRKRLLDIPLDPFEGKPMPSLQIPLPRFLETRSLTVIIQPNLCRAQLPDSAARRIGRRAHTSRKAFGRRFIRRQPYNIKPVLPPQQFLYDRLQMITVAPAVKIGDYNFIALHRQHTSLGPQRRRGQPGCNTHVASPSSLLSGRIRSR